MQTYIEVPLANVLTVRAVPKSPCVNTPPVVNDDKKAEFTYLTGVKGELLEYSVPLELFMDEVRKDKTGFSLMKQINMRTKCQI